ncbi:MAG: pyridoxal phosphate-dependent aminotransferase [Fusobacteriaceae bacterium]|nr:pyridoxal phosphate-dependent aminotransferase [Fusobacteriaceae bacterium]MBP6468247.1 pyridoxal phosphate-dependent aminotransferase [Fusobacteriaceae bacterium]MBP9596650.1 pyridoxal phosphate-dependent aminotransferase [Fusobacteriaceae bacterium]
MFSKVAMNSVSNSSMIRKMFEEGEKLAKIHGADNVFDFSIGNPYKEPPRSVKETIKELVDETGIHRYMANAGFPEVRERVAKHVSRNLDFSLDWKHIVMASGAAGGLNVVFKSILNEDEEVIVFAPYFVEYGFYAKNHGGNLKVVDTTNSDFMPTREGLRAALNEKTKAVLINSPNNPSGALYNREVLEGLAAELKEWKEKTGKTVFLISDEPYAEIVFDGHEVPNILGIYNDSIIVTSFSKSLGLAGQRIGYIAVNPKIENIDLLMDIMTFATRTLGFVSASALWQKAVAKCIDEIVDVEDYKEKRDILYNHLTSLGFEIRKPEGTFYLFPKSPISDKEFTALALKHNILVVPGSGFGSPGYFRISYCVPTEKIMKSLDAWTNLAKEIFGK